MAFKRVETSISYPLSTAKTGDKLVNEGLYTGYREGVYGKTHLFKEKSGKVVGLSGGQLNYMIEDAGIITEGRSYNVFYEGKVVIQKGAMAGKEAHQFAIEADEDEETVEVTKSVSKVEAALSDKSDISL